MNGLLRTEAEGWTPESLINKSDLTFKNIWNGFIQNWKILNLYAEFSVLLHISLNPDPSVYQTVL